MRTLLVALALLVATSANALTPNDSLWTHPWGMWHWQNNGQPNPQGGIMTPDADVDAPEAWELWTGDGSITVAIIGLGFDISHPDLAPNVWTNPDEIPGNLVDDDGNGYVDDIHGYDFGNGDGDPTPMPFGCAGWNWGTMSAGLIGAVGNNSIGVPGACWNVKLMSIKLYSDACWTLVNDWDAAINYAVANGARVIMFTTGVTSSQYDPVPNVRMALEAATAAGILTFGVLNNTACNFDAPPCALFFPLGWQNDGIVVVGSTTYSNTQFGQWGAYNVDFHAPGGYTMSTSGGSVSGVTEVTPPLVSAPSIAAGAAALIWSRAPSLTNLQIKQILMEAVDVRPHLAGKSVTGGSLNMHSALLRTIALVTGGGGGQQEMESAEKPPAATTRLPSDGKVYDVMGRRVDPAQRSGVTFGQRKRATVK